MPNQAATAFFNHCYFPNSNTSLGSLRVQPLHKFRFPTLPTEKRTPPIQLCPKLIIPLHPASLESLVGSISNLMMPETGTILP